MTTRERRIQQGSIIPDGMASPEVERLSEAFWDGYRASDGFTSGWEYTNPQLREVIRAGVVSLLDAQAKMRDES